MADAPIESGVRCMLMRGGSSKGAFFVADDIPSDPHERDRFLVSVMGTPDPRQIDGIGGAHPLTSKVAIVAPSPNDTADVDYLFLQLGVDKPTVSDQQNCGNLLAGVGPFAVERGLVAVNDGTANVRVRMLNTNSIATARFAVSSGLPVYAGDTAISGVPGTGAAIRLDFDGIAGGSTGSLLPTGSINNEIRGVKCTLIDNGMPVVVMRADALGVTGHEDCATLEANESLRSQLEQIRLEAGRLMGLGDVSEATIPKLTMVAPPTNGGQICTRTFIPHRCHDAIGVLGAVSVATAARLPTSPAAELYNPPSTPNRVVLEHPTGKFEAVVELDLTTGQPVVGSAGIIRTARKLMDGTVFARHY